MKHFFFMAQCYFTAIINYINPNFNNPISMKDFVSNMLVVNTSASLTNSGVTKLKVYSEQ